MERSFGREPDGHPAARRRARRRAAAPIPDDMLDLSLDFPTRRHRLPPIAPPSSPRRRRRPQPARMPPRDAGAAARRAAPVRRRRRRRVTHRRRTGMAAAAQRCSRGPLRTAARRRPSGDAPNADIAALTAALREGLGVHSLPPEALVLTPALMRLIGRLSTSRRAARSSCWWRARR